LEYLSSSGVPQQFDYGPQGVTADYGIVNEDDLFAAEVFNESAKFTSHAKFTQTDAWLDEGSPDVAIPAQDFHIR